MRVKHPTREAQQRQRQAAKHPIEPAIGAINIRDKSPLRKAVLAILDPLFACAESEFETPQSFVAQGCPAQMQLSESPVGTPLDGFPHQEVVGPHILEVMVGCSKFVEGLSAMVKKDRGDEIERLRRKIDVVDANVLKLLNERADRKSTRLNSSHSLTSRMPSSA